ncbi:MAG: cyclic nucleotide-binding domain-containing protein, partial [Deltaproteobacteria bacterium]|nr:cyclic nucleotide-binding domain-containing protein [Deltaproteobacteria bacterium]
MADPAITIRSIPLFSALSREDIAKVLGKLEEVSVPSGATIFSQGDQGDAFYVIQSGAVQVIVEAAAGRREVVAVLGAQDGFGEMALLSGEPRSASVVAIADTSLWRLSRESWNELIEKHPSWLLHFCATISKRLARLDAQYSYGRDAYRSLAENYYASRTREHQQFLRRAALLDWLDAETAGSLLRANDAAGCIRDLQTSQLPLLQSGSDHRLEFHPLFGEFLRGRLAAIEGSAGERELHADISAGYESLAQWPQAIEHALAGENWRRARMLLIEHYGGGAETSANFVKTALDRFPTGFFHGDTALIQLKADAMLALADPQGAYRVYQEALAHQRSHVGVVQYQNMARALYERREYNQAVQCLRSALKILEQDVG